MKRFIISCILSVSALILSAAPISIIPQPAEVAVGQGSFPLKASTVYVVDFDDPKVEYAIEFFNGVSKDLFGTGLSFAKSARRNAIYIRKDETIVEEGYILEVTPKMIEIAASSPSGVYYAFQSLRQMVPAEALGGYKIENVDIQSARIKDEPKMKYRGFLMDVGRHFFDVKEIKTFIDVVAMHKMNVFHWHLTEDQGWRIDIRKYPLLAQVGSVREKSQVVGTHHVHGIGYDGVPYGPFFYTQDQIREVVSYAEKNFVTVIPEIDMPGHSLSALAAYPHLGCVGKDYKVREKWGIADEVMCVGKETTFEFAEDVLKEILELFPSKYIHIGGDECPRTAWKACPHCQARMKAEGLETEAQLQTYFNHRMEALLKKHGRVMIGWDEILEGGVSPSTIVMSWRGTEGGIAAANAGNDVIMTPHKFCYINGIQSPDLAKEPPLGTRHPTRPHHRPLDVAYMYDPYDGVPADNHKHIIGLQACLWTEHVKIMPHALYMTLPRLSALAETGWSLAPKDFGRYLESLENLCKYYKFYEYPYSRSYWRDNGLD